VVLIKVKFIYCLHTPFLTYQDYCMIMHQAKYDGCIWITFECDTFKDHYYSWSGWLYLLMWQFCPRDLDFFNQTDKDAFKMWFHAEVCEAAHMKLGSCSAYHLQTTDLIEGACTSSHRQFIKSNFMGLLVFLKMN
jgi:hypothetical protein